MHLLSGQFLKPKVCIHNRPLFDLSPLISISLHHSVFSKVFIDVYSSKNLNNVSKLVEIAVARCKDAEISPGLYKLMPNIVFGKYESFVRLAPWTRPLATEILRQICMTFTVRGFHPCHFS